MMGFLELLFVSVWFQLSTKSYVFPTTAELTCGHDKMRHFLREEACFKHNHLVATGNSSIGVRSAQLLFYQFGSRGAGEANLASSINGPSSWTPRPLRLSRYLAREEGRRHHDARQVRDLDDDTINND